MLKNQIINLAIVEKVASVLDELNNEMIYVGGAVVSLYVTDEGAEPPRPTKDIDISVQVSTYSEMEKLRERLASKKIYPAPTETVMYRYSYENILIDFYSLRRNSLRANKQMAKTGI